VLVATVNRPPVCRCGIARAVRDQLRRFRGVSEGDPRGSLDLEVCDGDLVAVLDDMGIEKAVVVGWSTVGGRAIHFSATHPERVSALVLVDGCAH
jgi:pimeloyl-ACP methyl ester carboxylesterase